MQPATRWGRRARVLFLCPSAIRQSPSSWPRYASSIPKHVPSTLRKPDQHRDTPQRKSNGRGNRIHVSGQKPRNRSEPAQRSHSIHDDRKIIDPLSLERTLRAHQQANHESVIIRHTRSDAPPGVGPQRREPVPTIIMHLDLEREDVQEGRGLWEDYKGAPRPLSLDWEIIGSISRNLSVPWLKELNERQHSRDSAAARLSDEIRAADLYFSPSKAEWEATNNAVKSLEDFVLKADPAHIKLDIIGSRASGLATPLSDLDLNLVVAEDQSESTRNYQNQVLAKLFRTMKWGSKSSGQFNAGYFAAAARVPIISGTHISGLEFQIQSASSCYGSLEVVRHLCAEYPTLRALFKILKQSLKMRGLSDGLLGGLTSYPLINMIAVTLKMNAKTTDAFDFGKHLLQFLEYWSAIDTYTTGITHVPSTYMNPTHQPTSTPTRNDLVSTPELSAESISLVTQDPIGAKPIEFDVRKNLADVHESQNNFMLTLHDPANPHNDLGRSAYAIKHIQATFLEMLGKLKGDMKEWDGQVRAEAGIGKEPPSLLRGLIEGDYSFYNMERKRITAKRDEMMQTTDFEEWDEFD